MVFLSRVGKLFCKRPDCQYFRLCGHMVSAITQLYPHKGPTDKMYMNVWLCSSKPSLWTRNFAFYVIFKCHKILLSTFEFFPTT